MAMLGDGVNDVLALKDADCSVAMAAGSDAAQQVSHLVLLDSKFSALPQVVREGRRVINSRTCPPDSGSSSWPGAGKNPPADLSPSRRSLWVWSSSRISSAPMPRIPWPTSGHRGSR